MDKLMITGGGPLRGEVSVSGAKNAALPALCAALLNDQVTELSNMPQVQDVYTMCRLLAGLGMRITRRPGSVCLDGSGLYHGVAPADLAQSMRASILVLGPLLARLGHARLSLPGGCAIGARPVDMHLAALEQMGAEIIVQEGYIEARASRLKGADIHFDKVTVTGTENIMMAATLAQGVTTLRNAAREPEVVDLAELLIGMGAQISGHGTDTIVICGVKKLHRVTHAIIPDRIEAGTWICAAAISRGHVTVNNLRPDHLGAFLDVMKAAGLPMKVGRDSVEVLPHKGLVAVDITTFPYPAFPTDLQAQVMATFTQARGGSLVRETIFENRFMHVAHLQSMGADIEIQGNRALVSGPVRLVGARVKATDLRASASLVLAALVAEGQTIIGDIYHLDRGYAQLEQKLHGLGVHVRRLTSLRVNSVKVPVSFKAAELRYCSTAS